MNSEEKQKQTVINIREIDWNLICKELRRERSVFTGKTDYWDKRAPSFARNASQSDYAGKFLRLIDIKPHWTVLDVGCAAGTLAIPLAERVKKITALDISGNMLALLQDRYRKLGITNIHTVHAGWEDDWDKLGIGVHDVAVASRSLLADDFRDSIVKLNRAARRRVYLSTIVGDGPHDRRIFEALGRHLNPGPDYICLNNLLYQMGIHANVNFVDCQKLDSYESHEDAFKIVKCSFEEMSPEEEEILRAYLKNYLVYRDGKWVMSYRRKICWAVLWWDKE
jgi:SAM-dependent methyltransferase